MKIYIDTHNFYLRKYLSREYVDKYMSTWFFFDKEDYVEGKKFIGSNKKVYSFLWEYSDERSHAKIDKWKRAFKRNNIQIPLNINFYTKDYEYSERKIYLDIIETDPVFIDELFKNFSGHNCLMNLTQVVVEKTVDFLDFNFNFLDVLNPIDRFVEFVKIIDLQGVKMIILNGYHHKGELIKVLIHKKDNQIESQDRFLTQSIFENTYVSRAFGWETK